MVRWRLMIVWLIVGSLFSLTCRQVHGGGGEYGTIEGVVTDSASRELLPGVSVSLRGTILGATTRFDGRYKIERVKPGRYYLLFSAPDYCTKGDTAIIVSGNGCVANMVS